MGLFTFKNAAITEEELETIIENNRDESLKKGTYCEKDIQFVNRLNLEKADEKFFSKLFSQHIDLFLQNWDALSYKGISSHRPCLGPYIVILKKVVRRLLLPVFRLAFAEQIKFNKNIALILSDLPSYYKKTESIIEERDRLVSKINSLESTNKLILKELKEIRNQNNEDKKGGGLEK